MKSTKIYQKSTNMKNYMGNILGKAIFQKYLGLGEKYLNAALIFISSDYFFQMANFCPIWSRRFRQRQNEELISFSSVKKVNLSTGNSVFKWTINVLFRLIRSLLINHSGSALLVTSFTDH
jgi:hypothetical protein